MIRRAVLCILAIFGVSAAAFASDISGDADRGAALFRKCKACHQVGSEAKNKVGPGLVDVVDAPIAAAPGFRYSKALKAMGEAGDLWTIQALDAFLKRPRDFAKGTRMSFPGLKRPQDRADVIAYLASVATATHDHVEEGFAVSADILAIEGDVEWGEYLSSECTTCHQADGTNEGIPGIVGWQSKAFVTAMHAYKQKHRENPVMQTITARLSNEEIAGLAAYFESLGN